MRQEHTAPVQKPTARVRNRLVISVAVVAVAVLGGGVPGIVDGVGDVHESQHIVDLAQATGSALALAHALADERDSMTEYVAAGRTGANATGATDSQRARVDRQIADYRGQAPASVRQLLDALPTVRRQALSGSGTAEDTFRAYTGTVQALLSAADGLAHALPARAGTGDAAALPPLVRAAEEASATRGLLLGALRAHGSRSNALTAAAQQTNVREQAAVADFHQLAPAKAKDSYDGTVTGPDVTTAEGYLARLTKQPKLSPTDHALPTDAVRSALSARVDLMRGVESGIATSETTRLQKLRDDDVSALELRCALAALSFLIAIGMSIQAARSMTRPLAALRLGARRVAADPAGEEPVAFKGRDDEFADVVRSVNTLREAAAGRLERVAKLEDERTRLIAARQSAADERAALQAEHTALQAESAQLKAEARQRYAESEQLRAESAHRQAESERLNAAYAALHSEYAELGERLAGLTDAAGATGATKTNDTFVSLSLRTLGLVERQLAVLENMESGEQDPERLGTLFKLDHLATCMRRHSENLLVLAGAEHGTGHPGPVSLLDVARAAVSEIEKYERVQIQSLPHAQLAGFAADDVSHLVAELLENATTFSPPEARVQLSAWLMEGGEIMLSVQDEGIGMAAGRLAELNELLAAPEQPDALAAGAEHGGPGLGLYVVARLAARHGIRVSLREQQNGGITAVAVLPAAILPADAKFPPAPVVAGAAAAPAVQLPGSIAEANSNALPANSSRTGNTPLPKRAPEPAAAQTASPVAAAAAQARPEPAPATGTVPQQPAADAAEPYADPLIAAAERTIQLAAVSDLQPKDEHARADAVEPAVPGHEPATEAAAGWGPAAAEPADESAVNPITGKGLPKRTPKVVAPRESAPAPKKSVDAEALRRRLGGFRQGALAGRRDVEAEITGTVALPDTDHHQAGTSNDGGTLEEGRD